MNLTLRHSALFLGGNPPDNYSDPFTGADGSMPDTRKWEIGGSPDIQNNMVEITNTPGSAEQIVSRRTFTGDFDVQVDFSIINAPTVNSFGCDFLAFIDSTHAILIRAARFSGALYFQQAYINGGSWQFSQVSRTNNNGKLRIVRAGTSFSTFKVDGAGTFGEVSTTRTIGSAGNSVSIVINNSIWDTNPAITCRYDNYLINSGDVAPTVYDPFTGADDSAINVSKWSKTGSPDIQGNTAELSQGESITSLYTFNGNFEIQIDVAPQSPPSINSWVSSLGMLIDDTHQAWIGFEYDNGSKQFVTGYINGGSWTYSGVSRTNNYGSLKISRSDNGILLYYKDGSGVWTLHGTIKTIGSTGNTAAIYSTTVCWNNNPSITSRFDNYTINNGYTEPTPETGGGFLVGANPLVGGNVLCGQGCLIN